VVYCVDLAHISTQREPSVEPVQWHLAKRSRSMDGRSHLGEVLARTANGRGRDGAMIVVEAIFVQKRKRPYGPEAR